MSTAKCVLAKLSAPACAYTGKAAIYQRVYRRVLGTERAEKAAQHRFPDFLAEFGHQAGCYCEGTRPSSLISDSARPLSL